MNPVQLKAKLAVLEQIKDLMQDNMAERMRKKKAAPVEPAAEELDEEEDEEKRRKTPAVRE